MSEDFIWSESYRPKTVDECILPEKLKKEIKEFISKGQIPNFIFSGTSGTGKTTLARAIANELDADLLYINASKENGIDVLRTKIQQFVSTVSLNGGVKIVLLDEGDYLNANSIQPALRSFIDEFSKNARFIITCNYKSRLIEPLISRFTEVDFKFSDTDRKKIAGEFFNRVTGILKENGVKFDPKSVAALVSANFPDFRKTLDILQRYSLFGEIDIGVLSSSGDNAYTDLIGFLAKKEFTEVRKWVTINSDLSAIEIFDKLYTKSTEFLAPPSVPQLILILADYQYKSAFVANQEINTMAALTEIMSSCSFR